MKLQSPTLALLVLSATVGCVDEDPAPAAPIEGPISGYYPLQIDTDLEGVTEVRVGGILALHPTATDAGVEVLFQGLPGPGLANITLTHADGTVTLRDAFEGLPPLDPAFDRVVSFGASLSQGVQDGTPTFEGTLDSPALAVARQLGAFHGQPQLVPGLFPTLGLDTVGPAPDCNTASVPDFITAALTDVLPMLAWPDGSGLAYELGRSDPLIEVRNVSAGNFQVDDVLHGSSPSELPQNVLGGLSFAPGSVFGAPPYRTMLEAVEELEPTLIMSFDLLGNDALSGDSGAGMAANLPPLVQRLADTGAHVFLADMADPALLEGEIGSGSQSTRTQRAEAFNALLNEEAQRHDNVHVVPFAAEADALLEAPMVVDGRTLGMGMFGGMLSFDGLHFSSTGYAMLADLFVREINDVLGTDAPPVDIAAVLDRDIHSPDAVRAAGRDPQECTGR